VKNNKKDTSSSKKAHKAKVLAPDAALLRSERISTAKRKQMLREANIDSRDSRVREDSDDVSYEIKSQEYTVNGKKFIFDDKKSDKFNKDNFYRMREELKKLKEEREKQVKSHKKIAQTEYPVELMDEESVESFKRQLPDIYKSLNSDEFNKYASENEYNEYKTHPEDIRRGLTISDLEERRKRYLEELYNIEEKIEVEREEIRRQNVVINEEAECNARLSLKRQIRNCINSSPFEAMYLKCHNESEREKLYLRGPDLTPFEEYEDEDLEEPRIDFTRKARWILITKLVKLDVHRKLEGNHFQPYQSTTPEKYFILVVVHLRDRYNPALDESKMTNDDKLFAGLKARDCLQMVVGSVEEFMDKINNIP
jgi:hypothetical protein